MVHCVYLSSHPMFPFHIYQKMKFRIYQIGGLCEMQQECVWGKLLCVNCVKGVWSKSNRRVAAKSSMLNSSLFHLLIQPKLEPLLVSTITWHHSSPELVSLHASSYSWCICMISQSGLSPILNTPGFYLFLTPNVDFLLISVSPDDSPHLSLTFKLLFPISLPIILLTTVKVKIFRWQI